MHNPLEGDLLDRYLAGTLSLEEAERVRAFLDADATRRGVMAGVHAWMRGEDLGVVPYDVTLSLRELAVQIDKPREARSHGASTEVDGERTSLRMSDHRHPVAMRPTIPGRRGAGRQTLRWIVRTMFAEVTSRAVVALLGRKATTLTEAEIERLRGVVEQAETEDE